MGKKKPDDEAVSLEEARLILKNKADAAEKRTRESAERKGRAHKRKFEDAMIGLPASATPARELAWIRAHPAMCRRDRQKGDDPVLVTADDILKPPHGKAPSQSAVISLQGWVNKPEAFHSHLMQVHRKQMGDPTEHGTAEDDGLPAEVSRIDEMLQILTGAVPPDAPAP